MRAAGSPYKRLERGGFLMPVVKLEMRYHKPARFEDNVIIQTRLVRLGRATVTFENRILREDDDPATPRTLLVEGRVDLACVDPKGQIRRMPDALADQFKRFLYPGRSEPA